MRRSAAQAGQLRVLIDVPADAAWNMAVDEALLSVGRGAALRLYGWSPHAVSLGYFQRFADFADLPAETPIVRRLTGGGAIHHGDEVTFALTCDPALLPRIDASYRALHDAAVRALQSVGVADAHVVGGAPASPRPEARWCFAEPGGGDVVTPRGKLLGSAQRRIASPRPRILHHGSIVLKRPSLTPFVAAVADTRADEDAAAELRDALVREFTHALRLAPRASRLTDEERALATALSAGRYRDASFLRRR
ncbi:MAG: lipoate--protein ligase family protein [Planctomycetes bacterium]|nr:lipoate--protein ligase family protein [Planctomycetota bacterium]